MRYALLPLMIFAAALPLFLSIDKNHGVFVYTLDDPYIHLALASEISNGHYGINGQECSAPSSSVLWPFLLVPFSWAGVFAPLAMNLLFALGTVAVLKEAFGGGNGLFAAVSIFAFNLAGLVLTGMEHSLQVLLTAAAAWGMVRYVQRGMADRWLFAVLFLAPLVRYECLAVSLPALLFLFLAGERKASLITGVSLFLCLASFSLFLLNMGLGALPASVLAKSSVMSGSGRPASIFGNLLVSLNSYRGMVQTVLLVPLGMAAFRKRNSGVIRLLALSVIASILLHLLVGRSGWFHRYGVYIWVYSITLCFFLYRGAIERHRVPAAVLLLVLSADYLSGYTKIPDASSNIYRQQYQMSRFVHQWLNEPVAVNDLGLVAMDYEPYVLDLWGLASREALSGAYSPAWVDSAAGARNINCAIVYRDEIPGIQHWTPVARMELQPPLVVCVSAGVDFLEAPRAVPGILRGKLEDFAATLPDGVDLIWYDE